MQIENKFSLFNFIKLKLEETLSLAKPQEKNQNLHYFININFASDFPLRICDENQKNFEFRLKLLKQGTNEKIDEYEFYYLLGS